MKLIGTSGKVEGLASPPSRAAWIEISAKTLHTETFTVAAFTGGVD